jgi:hypothetical protein
MARVWLDLPTTGPGEVLPEVSSLASFADQYHVLNYYLQLMAFHSTHDLAQPLSHLPSYDALHKSHERISRARETPGIKPHARQLRRDVHALCDLAALAPDLW